MRKPSDDNHRPAEPNRTAPVAQPTAAHRVWRISVGPVWLVLKYLLAALYFVFDETGQHVKRLAVRFKPLRWYFGLIKLVRLQLVRHGLRSPSPAIRAATPFAALPFIVVPGLALLPLKLLLVAYMLTKPILCVGGLIAAKFFSAIFIKNTWDILRPIARRNAWLAWVDDYWQWLERWAKSLMTDLKRRIMSQPAFQVVVSAMRQITARFKLRAAAFGHQFRTLVARMTGSA